jgi:uncharacterized protein YdcH (DUF465 family)
MPISPREAREYLMARDAEFQKLAEEHNRYEAQLEQLSKQPYLNAEDLLQEVTLKKLKLRVKDQMEQRIARCARGAAATPEAPTSPGVRPGGPSEAQLS